MSKKSARIRRATRGRSSAKTWNKSRACVHRSNQHIYVQAISPEGKVLTSASTMDKELRTKLKNGSNIDAAKQVGALFAARCKKLGVDNIMFDRSGFKYHGRIKALADAVRENGFEEF